MSQPQEHVAGHLHGRHRDPTALLYGSLLPSFNQLQEAGRRGLLTDQTWSNESLAKATRQTLPTA